jgi:hypothetical protein
MFDSMYSEVTGESLDFFKTLLKRSYIQLRYPGAYLVKRKTSWNRGRPLWGTMMYHRGRVGLGTVEVIGLWIRENPGSS